MLATPSDSATSQVESASSTRRPFGTLVVLAVSPEERPAGPVAEVGGCRGFLTVGRCTVEATDGQLLGLVAWVMNARTVQATLSTVKEHSYRVESKTLFQSATIDRRRASSALPVRDEAWFLVRFAKALYGAYHAGIGPRAVTDAREGCYLTKAIGLVPEEFQVRTQLPRVATWAPPD